MVQTLEHILGFATEPGFSEAIHALSHRGRVEYLTVSPDEIARRRFRLMTDSGTDCAIVLSRAEKLADGAILKLDADGAIVVRMSHRTWLTLDAPNKATAMELGYFAGNLHWKVRFGDGLIHIALEGPLKTYLDRLDGLITSGKAILVGIRDEL
ncbi:MAG: urease accessory protein UreE [Alphaproteobacteria bacterium]|nr:urease accessory protein UreE [Alphaproteobacteria bacterium]